MAGQDCLAFVGAAVGVGVDNNQPTLLPVAAFGQQGAINYGFLTAFSIIYAAPAVGVYFLLRRNMNTGFAGVGVKG